MITKLQRLAGFDAVIMPGFGERMMTPEQEVLENVEACLAPMGAIRPSLPVPGGSDWAGTLEAVHRKLGSVDFGFVPGRGVFGHPMGPQGGAASIRQAWDACVQGLSIGRHALSNPELKAAIETFGAGQMPISEPAGAGGGGPAPAAEGLAPIPAEPGRDPAAGPALRGRSGRCTRGA